MAWRGTVRLESTDFLLIRELIGWTDGAFPKGALQLTLKELSERTGLHRNTVQRRLRALREGGVLEGFLYEPRPAWLGLVRAGHLFEGVAVRDAAHLQEVLAAHPSVSIAALHAQTCFLHSWHDDERAMMAEVGNIRRSLGATGARTSFLSSKMPRHPSDSLEVTRLDRRLLLAMRRGFDRSVSRIAEEVGVSRRTAARRISRLVAAEAGALLPILRPGRIEGSVLVLYDPDTFTTQTLDSIRKAFPDRLMGPTAKGVRPMALVSAPNMDEAARRLADARRLPGMQDLQLYLMRDWVFPAASDRWLAERVQNAPPLAAKG